jgi:hypothetical protein
MKNLYLLSTDKLTRLHFDHTGYYFSENNQLSTTINSIVKGRNMYITSDEEIKVGDFFYNRNFTEIHKCIEIDSNGDLLYNRINRILSKYAKKIILTTDLELIKDNVQAIDDEFLEWFINNPSCEYVEINEKTPDEIEIELNIHGHDIGLTNTEFDEWLKNGGQLYKIIIPPEEPKQECKGSFKDCFKPLDECTCDNQESLEEAMSKNGYHESDYDKIWREGAQFGTKWQSQRSYSEEEVLELLNDCRGENPIDINKWFEQSKKK